MIMNIQDLYVVCEKIKNTGSRKEKENIIYENKDYEDFKILLKFLFDDNITTGIDSKKINKELPLGYLKESDSCNDLPYLLNYVEKHNTGKDIDISTIKIMIHKLSGGEEHIIDFLKEIVTKSLRLGIDSKTINKVYGYNLIPVFDIQLGTPIEKCVLKEGTWFSLSQKLNGTRCVYKQGTMYTRQGKKYTGLQHIINDIKQILPDNNIILDGELILKDRSAGDSASFQIGTGIATSDAEDKSELKLVVFDIITIDDFTKGVSELSYKERKQLLIELQRKIEIQKLPNIEVVKFFYEGNDQSEIMKWLDYTERNDMEGCMLNLDTPYECRRTKNLMKIKKFFDVDLECVSINPGTGRLKHTLGQIGCKYKNNIVYVGSGFTDRQRDYYWNHPDEIVGHIVTVKYKEETQNKNGSYSLQFPVFIIVRKDKSIND